MPRPPAPGRVAVTKTAARAIPWLVAASLIAAPPLVAQVDGFGADSVAAPSDPADARRGAVGGGIFGRAPAQSLGGGSMMLAVHPFIDTSKYPLVTDDMDGVYVRYGQLFAARFINSYGDTSWVVAIERHWGSRSLWVMDFAVGYRAGIITGYDERLVWLGRYTPVLPLGGIVGSVHVGPVGGNVFWAYRAISIEAAVRCC